MYYKDKSCILHNIYEPCLRVGWMEFVITAWVRTSCPHSGMATPSFLCKSWECESQMWLHSRKRTLVPEGLFLVCFR